MTMCEAEGLKMWTNLRYFSGKLHGGAVMSNEKEKGAEKGEEERLLTSGALRCWRCIGLVLSTTGCMGELADGLPQLAI